MLARVAETVFWMARYLERAEGLARLINVNSHLIMDLPKGIAPGWEPIINITGTREDFIERQGKSFDEDEVLGYLMSDCNNCSSIASVISMARENARTIRDVIPRESWEQINALHYYVQENLGIAEQRQLRFGFLNAVILRSQTITGLLSGTMNHDECYTFLRLGRNLERADMTSRIIDVRSANLLRENGLADLPFDNIQWVSVLKSLSAYQMYRQRMQVRVSQSDVLKFLMLSEVFPRAIMHCVQQVERDLSALPQSKAHLKYFAELKNQMKGVEFKQLDQKGLYHLIDDIQINLNKIGDALREAYFSNPVQQMQQSA